MNNKLSRTAIILLAMIACIANLANGSNLRQITNRDGLTNSAVLSIGQTADGFMWFGTCDGLNFYNGVTVIPFEKTSKSRIEGNLVEIILTTDDNSMWIMTNYGISRVECNSGTVLTFPQLKNPIVMRKDKEGNIFVSTPEGKIYYYNEKGNKNFNRLSGIQHDKNIIDIIAHDDRIYAVTTDGIYGYNLSQGDTPGSLTATKRNSDIHMHVKGCYHDDDKIFVINDDNMLMCYDFSMERVTPLINLSEQTSRRGAVSDILYMPSGDIFISFYNDGVIRLHPADNSYRIEDIGVNCGVFCLKRDRNQELVFIGSDGNGVYVYDSNGYDMQTITYPQLSNAISTPIRSVLLDSDGHLWLGTKSQGLVRIDNFDMTMHRKTYDYRIFNTDNSDLESDMVYALAEGKHKLIWIGSEDGLNYYQPETGKIHKVRSPFPLKYIHAISEERDSVLWLSTVGDGVMKCIVGGPNNSPEIISIKQYTHNGGIATSNFFFSMTHTDSGKLYFSNRGFGIFNLHDGVFKQVPYANNYDMLAVNDAFAIESVGDTIWIGTGAGLMMKTDNEERLFDESDNFPKSSIHDICNDGHGSLWVATNKGLVHYNPTTGQSRWYNERNGLTVSEFSDGASFRKDDYIFFGGINGVVCINCDQPMHTNTSFVPTVFMTQLSINGHNRDFAEYFDDSASALMLAPDENTFTISFSSTDFVNGDNYIYYYRMGEHEDWMRCSSSNDVSFTNMSPGSYTLQVQYLNPVTNVRSEICTLPITIRSPWYLSTLAKLIYLLILLSAAYYAFIIYKRNVKRKQQLDIEAINRQHKEEIYEEKLRFFTNITHEFCTPITLIYGPCEKILAYGNSDGYINKYIGMIKSNAERLNALIQEVIDLRRMETGNKRCNIQQLNVSNICANVVALFSELATQNNINVESDITPDIIWNSDQSCLNKILYNLISNAFKYTPAGGTVKVSLKRDADRLKLCVYNTGKGIRPEERDSVFNRYRILDNVEENATKGLSARNGLGLAICHNVVKLLGGDISIDSTPGEYAAFIVSLPDKECNTDKDQILPAEFLNNPNAELTELKPAQPKRDTWDEGSEGRRILAVDDHPDMLTLIIDSLPGYCVKTATNAQEALDIIKTTPPDLLLTDIMMPGIDGIELTKMIKDDRHTKHIPVVMLSARNDTDDKVTGLNTGADAYVGKPFKASYLNSVISRLLDSRATVKEYFNTSASAYEYSGGKLMHKEDKEFIDSVVEYIDKNIEDTDLGVESLAEHLQMGVRNLYRRFKDMDQLPPNDFIKRHKINRAAKLLLTTNKTVQEIMYSCGFSNRSHFYKEFAKHYEVPPGDYRRREKEQG